MQDCLGPLIETARKLIEESDLAIFTKNSYNKRLSSIDRHYPFRDRPLTIELLREYFADRYGQNMSSVYLNGVQRVIRRVLEILLKIQKNEEIEFHNRGRFFIFDEDKIILPRFNEFLDSIAQDACQERLKTKKRELSRFNNFVYKNNIEPKEVNIEIVEHYLAAQEVPRSQLESAVHVIRKYYKYLFENNVIARDISHSFPKVPRYRSKVHSVFSAEEIKQILDSIDQSSDIGKRDYVIMLFLSLYGLRSGDIANLKFKNIDFLNNTFSITTLKTGKEVSAKIPNRLMNALKNYLVNVRAKSSDGEYIFVSLSPKFYFQPLKGRAIRNIVTKYCRHLNLKPDGSQIGGHSFRRAVASILAENKISLPVIKDILGHQDEKMSGHYIDNSERDLRSVILQMPKFKSGIYYELQSE